MSEEKLNCLDEVRDSVIRKIQGGKVAEKKLTEREKEIFNNNCWKAYEDWDKRKGNEIFRKEYVAIRKREEFALDSNITTFYEYAESRGI